MVTDVVRYLVRLVRRDTRILSGGIGQRKFVVTARGGEGVDRGHHQHTRQSQGQRMVEP